jgi:phosphatidylglycerol lysyltransferase
MTRMETPAEGERGSGRAVAAESDPERTAGVLRILGDASPLVAGPLLFSGGMLKLVFAALPQLADRLEQISRWAPLGLIEVSHLLGSLMGTLMLFLAYGVSRRMAMARKGAIFLTLGGAVFAWLHGSHWIESAYLLALCALFLATPGAYWRQSRLSMLRPDSQWLILACVAIAVGGWIGLLAYEAAPYSDDLWWRFMLEGDLSRYLRAGLVVLAVATLLVLWALSRSARPDLPSLDFPAHAAWLDGAASAPPEARLALMGDKLLFRSPSGASCLPFAVRGNAWIAMGGGAGAPGDIEDLVWSFRSEADRRNAWVALYALRTEDIAAALAAGLSVQKIGEAAVIHLGNFSLEGGARSALRQTLRRGDKAGLTFEVVERPEPGALMTDLEAVSTAWLVERRSQEKAFSLGRFDPAFLRHETIAIARLGGAPVAFVSLLVDPAGRRLAVDLMRYSSNAPQGAMEWLLLKTAVWAKEGNWTSLDLGMAPLSGLADRRFAPLIARIGALVYQRAGGIYGFEGLRRFKDKFRPDWEPVYMAAPPGGRMALALLRVALLTSGGWRGLLFRSRPE